MCIRIYTFFVKKKHTHKQTYFHKQIYSYEFTFLPLQKIIDRKVLLEWLFKWKLCLENSTKLENFVFAATQVKISHFWKEEYYFFWPLLLIQGGFLSYHVITSCGIKLCNILITLIK